MATATDFTSIVGTTGFVGQVNAALTVAPADLSSQIPLEMVEFSRPTDQSGGTSQQLVFESAEQVTFSSPMDTEGAIDHASAVTVHGAFDQVPRVFKMRGWSTTLGQYVYWSSVGDPFTEPPIEYGTVINTTSELLA